MHIGKTQSGAFLDVTASDHETSEVRLLDARTLAPKSSQLAQGQNLKRVPHLRFICVGVAPRLAPGGEGDES